MESSQIPQDVHARFGKAWTAYVRPCALFLVLFAMGAALFAHNQPWFGALVWLLATAYFVYRVLTLRSVALYTNDDGVWLYSGILPWSKGVRGVKWRDVEDAAYYTGFFSWALRSYTIRVGHRFTKTSEIVLDHMWQGQRAVEHINAHHREVLALRRPDEEPRAL